MKQQIIVSNTLSHIINYVTMKKREKIWIWIFENKSDFVMIYQIKSS